MISEYLRCFKFWAADKKARGFYQTGPLKTKGFTLVEVVVACTLIVILTSMATTSIYDVVHSLINIKSQYQSIQNIIAVHRAVAQAKMNYATDLALLISNPPIPADALEAQREITRWNQWASQSNNSQLIARLITPDSNFSIPIPLTPGSTSYLPTSNNAKITNYVNGNPVVTYIPVQITSMNTLLEAFQLTDDLTPTGNIVATITVGPMLDLTTGMRPTLPIVDWKSGTLQEIQF